jgi:hypothetical protein
VARCNPYGWENPDGPNPAGGLLAGGFDPNAEHRWHCGAQATVRARWVCSHVALPPGQQYAAGGILISRLQDGHASGQPVDLCLGHARALSRRSVRPMPCPRCVAAGPDHKCWIYLEPVS